MRERAIHHLGLIVGICLSIISLKAAANGEINRTDETGRRQGYWIITGYMTTDASYAPNAKVEEGEYVNNLKEGLWKRYWPNGKLKTEITYAQGHPQGWYRTYYDTGVTEEEGGWWNSRNTGYFKRWHTNGNAQQMFNFNNSGKREGLQRYFYENGNIELEVFMVNGTESGVQRRFNEDGTLAEERTFENGKVVPGSVKTYAQPQTEEKKKELEKDPYDPKVGTTSAPVVTSDQPNKADIFKANGFNTLYNESGQLSEVGEFKKGKLANGKVYRYNSSGLLIRIEIYRNGKYIGNGVNSEEERR
jgi:antitoxin component YwqK of YwqJK toxin-antitoxin module